MILQEFVSSFTTEMLVKIVEDFDKPDIPENSQLRSIALAYFGEESHYAFTEVLAAISIVFAKRLKRIAQEI